MRSILALLLALVAALALVACGSDDDEGSADTAGADITAPEQSASEGCTDVEAPEPKGEQSLKASKGQLADDKQWVVVVATNCGTFEIELDTTDSPKTAASFADLVKRGFYDGTTFHRIVPGFVIQGGDPAGTGEGGPGYSVVEAPPKGTAYTRGIVAMAKTQLEEPGTSGSQFFVVTASDSGLPPDYAIVGEVIKGMDVVARIEAVPSDPQERPLAPVVMEKVTLEER